MYALSASARPTTYGLAIGNNAPPLGVQETMPTLLFADDDAARYFQYFRRLTQMSTILSVLDVASQRRYPEVAAQALPPTQAELTRVVQEFAASIRKDIARGDTPVVYIAFSGHGARNSDGTFFLSLADGQLTRQQLYDEVLSPLDPAVIHLIIDACYAESVVGGKGSEEVDVPSSRVEPHEGRLAFELQLPSRFSRVGVLLATTVEQQAHEWSRLESGVFTHEVLSALSGAADVNGDEVVEYSELQAFIASANSDIADPRATPRVVAFPPRINVHTPLVTLSDLRGSAFLAGRLKALGHFFIELKNGQRVLDAHFAEEAITKIALPAGQVFIIAGDKEAEIELRQDEHHSTDQLEFETPSVVPRGSVSSALGKALFASPYSATYYRGFVDSRGQVSVSFRASEGLSMQTRMTPRKAIAVTSIAVGGAALITSGILAVLAIKAQTEFEKTNLQRAAFEARTRADEFTMAAAIAGGTAAALGVAGWLLWPSTSQTTISATIDSQSAGILVKTHF